MSGVFALRQPSLAPDPRIFNSRIVPWLMTERCPIVWDDPSGIFTSRSHSVVMDRCFVSSGST